MQFGSKQKKKSTKFFSQNEVEKILRLEAYICTIVSQIKGIWGLGQLFFGPTGGFAL
jgi:hypothetical protein